jgi:hypothetical protein
MPTIVTSSWPTCNRLAFACIASMIIPYPADSYALGLTLVAAITKKLRINHSPSEHNQEEGPG